MKKKALSAPVPASGSLVKQVLLVCLAALLHILAFPRAGIWILAWVQAIPFWYVIARGGMKKAFWLGWLYGALCSLGISYWVFHALNEYSNAGFGVSLLFLVIVNGAFIGIFFALYGAAANRVMQQCPSPFMRAVSLAALWVVMEYGRAHLLGGIPWCLLGHSQYEVLRLIQVADITGVYGLSFLIIFTSYTLYNSCTSLPDKRLCLRRLLPALAVVLVVVMYGSVRLWQLAPPRQQAPAGAATQVAVIQGSTPQDAKWKKENTDEIMSRHLELTAEALAKGAKLVIWPETTIPFYLQDKIPQDLRRLLRAHNAELITGGPRYSGSKGNYKFYNSAFHLDENGIRACHDKLKLLPFGEFFPLGFVDLLNLRYAAPRQYTAGTRFTLFKTAAGAGGTLICYEVIFPRLARGFVNQGADFLINISNDSWFGPTSAHYQHFAMAVFRCVENRRPMARAANTGISGFIDASGRIVERLPTFTEGISLYRLAAANHASFYCLYGDVWALLCFPLGLVVLIKPGIFVLKKA